MAAQKVLNQVEAGENTPHIAQLSFAELYEGLSGVALREGKPVLSLKGQIDNHSSHAVTQRWLGGHAGSIIVTPIQSQEKLLGTLTAIHAPDGEDFTPGDTALLATLANQAGVAIERTSLLAELNQRATIDSLTKLLNRRTWFEQSERLVALATRTARPFSVVLLDIDHFKQVNDTYGHSVGDAVLEAVGGTLGQTIRRSDVGGRYGGEELVLFLPETDAIGALSLAERVRAAIARQAVTVERFKVAVTVSLGVAASQEGRGELATLVMQADQALYAAKHAGRNCARLFTEHGIVDTMP